MIPKKKILIVGGGIAGVALAGFLKDSEYDITIIERAPEWRTIGYAIGVWANGLDILRKLNLSQSFWDNAQDVGSGAVVDPLGNLLYEIRKRNVSSDQLAKEIPREELLHALVQTLPYDVRVFFNTTCSSVEQTNNGVMVALSNGTRERFDVVVGADGMRSSMREQVFGRNFLKSYGWHAVVGWIPASSALYPEYHIMNAPGAMMLAIPYRDKVTIAFSVPKKEGEGKQQILETFECMNLGIKNIVTALDKDSLFYDEIVCIKMKEWYKGNVVLIGDARHGISPISGFGTTLALGDAEELARCLKEFSLVSNALRVFAKRRSRKTRSIFFFSWLMEKSFTMENKFLILIRDFLLKYFPLRSADSFLKKALGFRKRA